MAMTLRMVLGRDHDFRDDCVCGHDFRAGFEGHGHDFRSGFGGVAMAFRMVLGMWPFLSEPEGS